MYQQELDRAYTSSATRTTALWCVVIPANLLKRYHVLIVITHNTLSDWARKPDSKLLQSKSRASKCWDTYNEFKQVLWINPRWLINILQQHSMKKLVIMIYFPSISLLLRSVSWLLGCRFLLELDSLVYIGLLWVGNRKHLENIHISISWIIWFVLNITSDLCNCDMS